MAAVYRTYAELSLLGITPALAGPLAGHYGRSTTATSGITCLSCAARRRTGVVYVLVWPVAALKSPAPGRLGSGNTDFRD